MKKLIAVLAIGLTMMSMSMTADAARRFGGGLSFGRSAPAIQRTAPAPKPALNQPKATNQNQQRPQQAAPAQTATPKPASPMRGMLMGLAAALGITALAHALGFGEGFVNFLMYALLAFVAFTAIRFVMGMFLAKRMAGAGGQYPGSQASRYEEPLRAEPVQQEPLRTASAAPMAGSVLDEFSGSGATQKTMDLPADFDVEQFLQVAETNFVKMQKAWDTGNVTALSDFTTDEVFLAVTHQLRERGAQDYQTEVVTLKSEFRGIVRDGDDYLAGVTFDGTLNVSGESERVCETWILSKPVNGKGGWLLSGIHQEDGSDVA